jgi:signal transduction histidine kinase
MRIAISDARRRARCQALGGGPPAALAQGVARTRRYLVVVFQLVVIAFLAVRGYPAGRLVVHAAFCLFYLVVCRYPAGAVSQRSKSRLLLGALLAYGGWIANTGGLASPLLPLGLGILSPAALVLQTRRQRLLFAGAGLGVLLALAFFSQTPLGALVAPLAPRLGRATPEYLLVAAGSIGVTAALVAGFWSRMTEDYDRVAVELGTRREELCNESEDRTRELEGAAARLAHELKNPLASIKCLSTHMARGAQDPKTAERLAVVSAEADRLQSIVDGFLSLSRGLGELSLGATRPFDIARELKLLLDIRATEAGLTLEVVGRADAEILADAKKIRRVLFYLVVNAMQASPSGKTVTIDVGPPCPMSGRTVIKVIDRGEGMSPDVLQRMKRPYFTTREGGTGLGVAVARALIEQHGGRLEYESAPGRGTTATIDLPRRPPDGLPRLVPDALRTPSAVD